MSEAMEVAQSIHAQVKDMRIDRMEDARWVARRFMPDNETEQVIDNVAEALLHICNKQSKRSIHNVD